MSFRGGDEQISSTETVIDTVTVFLKRASTWCLDFEQVAVPDVKTNSSKYEHTYTNEDFEGEYTVTSTTNTLIKTQSLPYLLPEDGGTEIVDENEIPTKNTYRVTEVGLSNNLCTVYDESYSQSIKWTINEVKEKTINYERFLGLWKNKYGEYYKGVLYDENGLEVPYEIPNTKDKMYPARTISSSEDGSDIDLLIELLSRHEDTQVHQQIMMYFWNVYTGKDVYNIDTDNILNLFNTNTFSTIGGSLYGGSFEEKIWFALLDAGFSKEAAAGALGNFKAESGMMSFRVNGMGIEQAKLYAENVNSGVIPDVNAFLSTSRAYGLCQWLGGRKIGLYNFTVGQGYNIDDEEKQIEYMLGELGVPGKAEGFATYQIMGNTQDDKYWSSTSWRDAATPEEAAEAFCATFERPGHFAYSRARYAREYYDEFYNLQRASEYAFASYEEKLQFLFPEGLPKTSQEMQNYLVTIAVPITTRDGVKTTANVTVHEAIANDLIYALKTAQDAGFKVYEVQGYSWRNVSGTGNISQHALGLAVDINVQENYCVYPNGKVDAGKFWNPTTSEFSIPQDGILVNTFKSLGWGWGGDWYAKKDYMHFSFTGR